MAMWIAWNITDDSITWPPSFERKVEIFYERTLGWQLHIADLLANGGQPLGGTDTLKPIQHSGFAVLHICLSYFETIGHYEKGNVPHLKDRDYFKEGVRSVFPQLLAKYPGRDSHKLLGRLYSSVRCGLYHNSMTEQGVGLGQPPDGVPLLYNPNTNLLAMSPERLPRALKLHLENFRERLLDPNNVDFRQNFERRFDEDYGITQRKP